MKIVSAVTTYPRTGVEYLTATLESLHDAGFETLAVPDTKHAGSWPTLRRALECLLTFPGEPEGFLVFQDDVLCAKGLADWLTANLWPAPTETIGVVSLYTAQVNLQQSDGWLRLSDLPCHKPFGACAYLFPTHAAQRLLANPPNKAFLSGSDTSVATFCIREKLDYWMHSPGFVKHIGVESTMGHTLGLIPERRAGLWITDCATMTVEDER